MRSEALAGRPRGGPGPVRGARMLETSAEMIHNISYTMIEYMLLLLILMSNLLLIIIIICYYHYYYHYYADHRSGVSGFLASCRHHYRVLRLHHASHTRRTMCNSSQATSHIVVHHAHCTTHDCNVISAERAHEAARQLAASSNLLYVPGRNR